jgi:hypothetical protein
MKKIHFALQYQIILGLILGSIFGLLFPVPKSSIQIRYLDKNKEKKIILQNQDSIIVNYWDLSTNKSFTKTFTNKQTPLIINYFKKISQNQNNINFEYYLYKNGLPFLRITHIIETNKVETLATIIKPIGNIFIQLLFLLAIPLVLTTLIAGTASLKDIKTLGKIGIKTLILYLFTTVLALIIKCY